MMKIYSTGKICCQILYSTVQEENSCHIFQKEAQTALSKEEDFLRCEPNIINQALKLKKKVTHRLLFCFYFIDPVFLFF